MEIPIQTAFIDQLLRGVVGSGIAIHAQGISFYPLTQDLDRIHALPAVAGDLEILKPRSFRLKIICRTGEKYTSRQEGSQSW